MTRTPSDELLKALEELRTLFPDWRFGQLVVNVATAAGATDAGAVWEVADEELLEAARRLVERNRFRDPAQA